MTRKVEGERTRKRDLAKGKTVLSAWAAVLNGQLRREIESLRPIEQRDPRKAASAR